MAVRGMKTLALLQLENGQLETSEVVKSKRMSVE